MLAASFFGGPVDLYKERRALMLEGPYRVSCDNYDAIIQVELRNLFSTLVPGSGSFQLTSLMGFGYGLGFWVVFTIIVSLTLTLTLIISLTIILP